MLLGKVYSWNLTFKITNYWYILAYLGAYGAHMFALRVWVGFGASL